MSPRSNIAAIIGRETGDSLSKFEQTCHSRQGSMGSLEDFPLVTSDLVYGNYVACNEETPSTEPIDGERPPDAPRQVIQSKDDQPSAPKPAKLARRRQDTGHHDAHQSLPRRSGRIRASGSGTKLAAAMATKPKNRVAKAITPKPKCNESGEWEIEKIVDSRIENDTLKHFYLVKWKGFASKDNTWEPKTNLTHCRAIIEAYEKGTK